MTSVSSLLFVVISGLAIGAGGRWVVPGPDPMPAWLTAAIGVAASLLGAGVVLALSGFPESAGEAYRLIWAAIAAALVASALLVVTYRRAIQGRSIFGREAAMLPLKGIGVARHRERLGVDSQSGVSANVELLRRAWAAHDRGDVEAFSACVTEDWREYQAKGNAVTLEDAARTMELHLVAFPDKHTEIHDIVASADIVACRCTTRASHLGKYLEVEPTGKPVTLEEMMFSRVRDGRICATWSMTDGPGFCEQVSGRTMLG
jgi:predicted ester cyclase/uncharacterized membrane protein YeaQ/YmgE (transglycosylase-associated protein family)